MFLFQVLNEEARSSSPDIEVRETVRYGIGGHKYTRFVVEQHQRRRCDKTSDLNVRM